MIVFSKIGGGGGGGGHIIQGTRIREGRRGMQHSTSAHHEAGTHRRLAVLWRVSLRVAVVAAAGPGVAPGLGGDEAEVAVLEVAEEVPVLVPAPALAVRLPAAEVLAGVGRHGPQSDVVSPDVLVAGAGTNPVEVDGVSGLAVDGAAGGVPDPDAVVEELHLEVVGFVVEVAGAEVGAVDGPEGVHPGPGLAGARVGEAPRLALDGALGGVRPHDHHVSVLEADPGARRHLSLLRSPWHITCPRACHVVLQRGMTAALTIRLYGS